MTRVPDAATHGTFAVVFPFHGGMTPARMRRSATDQVAQMPEARDLTFHGSWSFRVVKDSRGRPTHLVARIEASSPHQSAMHATAAAALAEAVRVEVPGFARWVDRELAAAGAVP